MLGALDNKLQLTASGRRLLQLPVEPRLGAMLLHASKLEQQGQQGTVALAATIAAVLENTRRFHGTDLSRQLRLSSPLAKAQYKQLLQLMKAKPQEPLPTEFCAELLSRAYPDRIAQLRGQGYLLANGTGASLSADDELQGSPWLVVADLRVWNQQALISSAVRWDLAALQQSWQAELQWQQRLEFDEQSGRFIAERQQRLGALVLKKQQTQGEIRAQDRQQAWLDYLAKKGLVVLNWSVQARQLQHRLALAAKLQPTAGWPDCSEQQLAATAESWLAPYLGEVRSLSQLKQLDLAEILRYQLSYPQQQQLDELLPASWRSVLGTYIPLDYQSDGEVQLAIRLQEMFGQLTTPTVGQGAVNVTITLLSPAKRPLQVTRDLASFWQNAYQDVKKEMRGRYPKHYWPDDPAVAEPTNKTKRAMG